MKKIISILVLAFMFMSVFTPASFAISQEATNYLTETFGAAGSYTGPLATSTTSKVYGNWKLRVDQYDTATSQGTEMTVMADPDDATNNVLQMKRTQKYDGYNGIVNLEAIIGLPKVLNTGAVAISFRLKHTDGYTLTIEPFLGELCPEYAMLYSNDYASSDYIRPEGTAQQALMRASGWHTYKFVIDYKANQTSLYIDEQLIGEPVNFATAVPNLNFVQLRGVGYAKTTYYLDDIKVDELVDTANYAVENLYFTDEDGMFASGAQLGGELGQAVITKASSVDGNGTAVFVYYDKNNAIKSVKSVDFTSADFTNNKATLTVGMKFPASNADIINGKTKVFLFNKMLDLKPLAAESEFSYKASTDPSFYLIGDSTMCEYDDRFYPRCGTGQALPEFFSDINIYNNAASGATTSSMLGGGNQVGYSNWAKVVSNVKTGDYVVLQLGINDSRNGIGVDTYIDNIDSMVTVLREKGVNVILASMVTDHIFTNGNYNVVFDDNGKFVSTTKFVNASSGEDYLAGLYEYMEEMEGKPGFRSIDMTALTAELIGPDATEDGPTRRYFILDCLDNWDVYKDHDAAAVSYNNPDGPDYRPELHAGDTTHLTIYGAAKFAQKMAQAIDDLNIELSAYTTNLTKEITYPYLTESDDSISPVLKERGFVPYTPEAIGIEVSAMSDVTTVSTSSAAEDTRAENLTDGDHDTYWEAAPPTKPEDKGKSLMFSKEAQSSAMALASYDITPQTKLVILEHDFLTTELLGEKAMPYFYSSTGKIALHTVLEDNTLTAFNRTMISEVEANRWYHIKVVLDVEEQTWKFYVDGKFTRKFNFREDAQDIAKIQYHMNVGQAGTFFIDNVKIIVGDETNAPIINDDFESYDIDTKSLNNMTITQGGGAISVEKYQFAIEHKFPQHIVLDLKREGALEQAEITFPEGREYKFVASISRDASYWSMCSDMTNKFYSGAVNFAFSPTRARYLRISIMESKGDYPASVSNVSAVWEKRNPIENLAFMAQVSTSSDSALTHDKRGINDNIIAEFDKIGEWRPNRQETQPWVQYNWASAHEIDRVVIHDSARTEDNILKGVLSFSDGSSLEVTDIPASGKTCIIDFPAKTVDWVRFTLKEFEGAPAVSEIQVFGVGEKPELVEYIEPWKVITLNQDFTSTWFLSADIDDDGEVEMLGCRCDVDQYVSANHPVVNACAFELDGSMIWTWGEAGAGDDDPGGDPGFQIYDIDNDGVLEVLMATEGYFVILNARTGQEEKRYPLPVYESDPTLTATDAIAIANISGNDYPSDIIIKTRYEGVWAFTKDWERIWSFDMPGGMHIGHRVLPVDINNDGYDEVSIGYCMINPDGSIRYMMDPNEFKSPLIYKHSHCDSTKMAEYFVVGDVDVNSVINENDASLLRKILDGEQEATPDQFRAADTDGDGELTENDYDLLGQKIRHEIKAFPNRGLPMEDVRICLCFCGGYDAVMIDGNGKRVWAQEDGMHYETIVMAQMSGDSSEKQIVTNPMIPSQEGKCTGTMPIYIFDIEGNLLEARYSFIQIRFPCVINWNGKQDFLYMGPEGLMYDGNMRIRARTLAPVRGLEPVMLYPQARGDKAYNLDLNGDGRQDIVNRTASGNDQLMFIYLNERGKITADDIGSGYNVTFY